MTALLIKREAQRFVVALIKHTVARLLPMKNNLYLAQVLLAPSSSFFFSCCFTFVAGCMYFPLLLACCLSVKYHGDVLVGE